MGSFGPLEIILIFLVVLLIFGAKRIPEIARGIGRGIREFKDATSEISRELETEGQDRQINQPQAPQQGQPQARASQQSGTQAQQSQQPQQSQQAQQPQSPSEPDESSAASETSDDSKSAS
jgi:sec-independent protein translocase protein TatA